MCEASVTIAGVRHAGIGHGLLVFVCAEPQDDDTTAAAFVDKLLKLRIFADEAGKMNRSVVDVQGALLIVSQFTLAADTSHGNRPGFSAAADPQQGRALFDTVLRLACQKHPHVASGVFGAEMQVALVNDGPVTIPLRLGSTGAPPARRCPSD